MLRFKGEVRLIKRNNLKLVERIKIDSENEYYYFINSHRPICFHLEKFRKVNDFKKFKTLKFNLTSSEFSTYFDKSSNRYRFNNIDLISEKDYKNQTLSEADILLYDSHLKSCKLCNHIHQSKPIRKRKKLCLRDQLKLANYVGGNQLNKSIMKELKISKQTIKNY